MVKKHLYLTLLALVPFGITAADFKVTVPQDATIEIGTKSKHYIEFTEETPVSQQTENGQTVYTFDLTSGKVYNYRTSLNGGLTHGGYFTMNADESKRPSLVFAAEDYASESPATVNHDPKSNNGYETGDIFVNINPQGYLRLKSGDTFDAHAMRTWQLSDNVVNNYFIEPDFHYTVLDLNGKPSEGVIEIEETAGSPWATIKAVGKGTALVLVTYDAIKLNYYSGADKKDFVGGSFWGAIWPENTAVYVVSVDEAESVASPNMVINELYNLDAKKNAGKFVDAEHDVFYYLDTDEGFYYTFTPENTASVAIAYPHIGERSATYSGFSTEGIVKNADGSYTVLLKEGRQIVRLADSNGNYNYQVLTAKPCTQEITNASRESSKLFQPGDKVKIQFSGLFHPANKISGIYNMSAYVTYNGTPSGSSLIQGSGQYTFGSAESAQAITIQIPEDYDVVANPIFKIDDGVIQVNGFGDPIGEHRGIVKSEGRQANLHAVTHKTYFGAIPSVSLQLSPVREFSISLSSDVEGADISVIYNGEKTLSPESDGTYRGTFGTYRIIAKKKGYRCFRQTLVLGEDDDTAQNVNIEMVAGPETMWDGATITEVTPDENDIYHVTAGSELAYLSQVVNQYGKKVSPNVVLDADIDLGDYDWTPIGTSSNYFIGTFNGNGHTVSGLYIDDASLKCAGLFGDIQGLSTANAVVSDVTVSGYVNGGQYVAGVVAKSDKYSEVIRCANYAEVIGESYVGGVIGYLSASTLCSISDSYNIGDISGVTSVGGVVGYNNKSAVVSNVFNIGSVDATQANTAGACVGGTTDKPNVTKLYSTVECEVSDNSEIVSDAMMQSGEVAYLLGAPFNQTIGKDLHPVFHGEEVLFDDEDDVYYNLNSCFALLLETNELAFDLEEMTPVELTATHQPSKANLPTVVWTSSDETVVTVEHQGTLQATLQPVAAGQAQIRVAHADNPDVYDTCDIFVTTSATVKDLVDLEDERVDVYDITGTLVLKSANSSELSTLPAGLYILRSGTASRKILLTTNHPN